MPPVRIACLSEGEAVTSTIGVNGPWYQTSGPTDRDNAGGGRYRRAGCVGSRTRRYLDKAERRCFGGEQNRD